MLGLMADIVFFLFASGVEQKNIFSGSGSVVLLANLIFLRVDKKADCTLTLSDADLLALMTGKLNPQTVSASSFTSCFAVYYTLITLRNTNNTVCLNSM